MAYREFHVEKQYAEPDVSQANATRVQGLTNLFRSRQQQQDQRRNLANQFQYDLDKGAYEVDQRLLTEHAKDVTQQARNDFATTGRLSMDTERKMKDGSGMMQISQAQMNREKQIRQNMIDRGTRDPYYNAQTVLDKLQTAHDHRVDMTSRGQILDQIEGDLNGIDTFRFDKYKADYVKGIGAQSKKIEFPLKGGGYKTKYDQRTFWLKDGSGGVDDDHAIRYLNSDSRVSQWYDQQVSSQLDAEIRKMKSSGDNRASWMNGMSEAEIKNELINNPAKNMINTKPMGVRVRDQAKYDLNEADRINTEVSYTGDQDKDTNNSGGLWKNQNILHTDAINSFAQTAKSAATGQTGDVVTYGPGGIFTQKSGKPMLLNTANPIRTDINRGLTTRNNKGNIALNMTGYQLMPVKAGGAPFALKSPTPDGMIEEINAMPLEYFDPNGKVKLKPTMQIGLNGYTINEAGVLNDIQNQRQTLASELHAATKAGDKAKEASLNDLMYELEQSRELIASGDYDVEELATALNKSGIRKIQKEWIIPASQADVATIRNVTGGFDLNKQDYWSPDMQAVNEAYNRRAEEAKAKNYGIEAKSAPYKPSSLTTDAAGKEFPYITNQKDYDELPSGYEYIDVNGNKRKKK